MNNAQPAFVHLHPFLEKVWQEVQQGRARSVFFQGTDAEGFSREITRFFARMPGEKVILRRDLDGRPLQQPWFPFLDFVKESAAGREPAAVDGLMAAAGVYSLHRPLLSSWLRGLPLERAEEMLHDELAFEQGRLEEGILALLGALSAEVPLLLLVNNLQLAGSAGLALAARLLDRPPPGRVLVVFLLDRKYRHLAEERAQRWSYFLEEVEEKSTILGSGLPEHPVALPPQAETSAGELIRRCRDAFLLFDHEECRIAGLAAAGMLQDVPDTAVPAAWSLLLETLGDVHCLLDEPDAALVFLDQLLHYCREHNLPAGLSAACRKTGYVYYLKEDNDAAGDFANQSLKFARQAEDELAVLRACCLLTMIDIRRHNMLQWEKVPDLLFSLLKKYRMKNTLSFFYTNSPLYFDKRLEEELALRRKAIAIAKELGNTCRLAHALQTKGVIYNYMGDEARTLRCYTRSLKLREQLGQPREISQVYNGMGYFHYLNGRYDEACRCFNRALEYLKNMREYIEIILTCYNLALVHFYTGQYARAIAHMEKLFVLIKTLGTTNIPFHSRPGLYAVAALCHLKHGNYLKGIEYLNKKNGVADGFGNDQEYHYHELAGALAAWYEGKDAEAAAHFDRAGGYLEKNAGISDFRNMFPPFFHEYGVFLKTTGNAAAAAAVWKKGLGYAGGSGFGYYRELLEAELAGEPPPRPQFRFGEVGFDFDVIIELARQDKNLVLLHKKISEINFLNNLHVILQREGDSRTYALTNSLHLYWNCAINFHATTKPYQCPRFQ